MAVTINGDGVVDVGGNASSAAYVRLYEDSDNGTNYVDLIAPASVASNRTITLPDQTGTIITTAGVPASALPAGSVLQVVSTTSAATITSTNSSPTATGLSVTITPTSTSSKILIIVNGSDVDTRASNRQIYTTIYRGATNLGQGGNTAFADYFDGGARLIVPVSMNYLDSPNTTSSTTYEVYAWNPGGVEWIFNSQGVSGTITAMEIAG